MGWPLTTWCSAGHASPAGRRDISSVVGSPGVGVDHAADMHVEGSHVWSAHVGNDPIQLARNVRHTVTYGVIDMAAFGPMGPVLAGWDFANSGDHLLYGTNPDAASFGGQQFTSQGGSLSMRAHSEYWERGSPSMQ